MDEQAIRRLVESIRSSGPLAPGDDDSVPVLTETVDIAPPGAVRMTQPPTASLLDEAARVDLEERIVQKTLSRLIDDGNLPGEPVREAVSAASQRFASMLASELQMTLEQAIQEGLNQAVREAVAEALDETLRANGQGR
jgi:flagellar biosynthesis/type III secretory pathway protein FliH